MALSTARARARRGRMFLVAACVTVGAAIASAPATAAEGIASFDGSAASDDAGRAAAAFAKLLPRSTAHSTGARHRRQIVSPSLTSAGDHLSALGALGAPTIAKDPAAGFVLDTGRGPLQIAPAWVDPAAPAPGLVNDAAAVFPAVATGLDALVRPTAAGISTLLRIDDSLAAESYSWTVASPTAHELRLLDDGGIAVVAASAPGGGESGAGAQQEAGVDDTAANDSGEQAGDAAAAERSAGSELPSADVLAVIAPPRAQDAKGDPLTTRFEVHGSLITLHVEHRQGTTRYDVAAHLDASVPDALDRPWVDAPATGPSQRGPDGLLKVLLRNGEVLLTHGPDPIPPGSDEGENPLGDGDAGAAGNGRGAAPPDPNEEDEGPVASAGTGPPYVCGGRNQRRIQALYAGTDPLESVEARIRSVLIGMNNKLYDESVRSGGERNPARFRFECDRRDDIEVRQYEPYGSDFEGVVVAAKDAGFRDPDMNYVIFSDGVELGACGEANQYPDDRASRGNLANSGQANTTYEGETPAEGTYAINYGRACWQVDVAMHENAHNMGAVSDNSPDASGRGHCDDGYDVMCYDDREEEGQELTYRDDVCLLGSRGMHFDCGNDTYFDTRTESGEWLSRHWNLGHANNMALSFSGTRPPPEPFVFVGAAPGASINSVYTALDDGTGAVRSLGAPFGELDPGHPAISPDGQSMVYQDAVVGDVCTMFWSRLDGSERRTLWSCNEEQNHADEPQFAGSNSKIVFTCNLNQEVGDLPDICGMNLASGARHVIADWPNAHLREPSEAGHRRLVAFTSSATPSGDPLLSRQIFVTKRDGTNPVQFTSDAMFGHVTTPQFSPDSNWIAFSAPLSGEDLARIWVARIDGTGLRDVSVENFVGSPEWTPDGHLAYLVGHEEGGASLVEVDPEAPDSRRVLVDHWTDFRGLAYRQPAYWQLGFRTPTVQPIEIP